jgi:AAA15 family ATPase/GTPase
MKRFFTLVVFLMICTVAGFGQEETNADAGRLQAYKIAYLTKKLNLTPQEAQRFWPIYNKYQEEIRTARINNKKQKTEEIETEEQLLNIRKKYNDDFAKVLNKEKVNTLYRSEREFGNMVQKELMERRQQKMNNRKKRN